MPLLTFRCSECEHVMEKFVHNIDGEHEIVCEECGCEECERQFSLCGTRVWLEAKEFYKQKIAPDAERIKGNMKKGNNKEFFDIYGDK